MLTAPPPSRLTLRNGKQTVLRMRASSSTIATHLEVPGFAIDAKDKSAEELRLQCQRNGAEVTVCECTARLTRVNIGFRQPNADSGAMSHDSRLRVLTVDDHPLFRQGIAALVEDEPDIVVVAEAATGRQAIELFRQHRPDVTLMDLQMPDMTGLEAIIAVRAEFPDARIIVLTTYGGDVQVTRALQAGACGYLLKSTLSAELLATIRAVHRGRRALSPEISLELAEHTMQDALSAVEVRVLRLIAEGNSNKEIAAQLSLTEDGVKGQVRSILAKLGANDRAHAAVIGLKRGII
jgi:DNA-binding NarL/FixJ family response regulator